MLRSHRAACSPQLLVVCTVLLFTHYTKHFRFATAHGAGSLSPSPSPATDSAPIFPRLSGSFSNRATNAAIDWNVATQWVMRQGNVTNVAGRIFALESLGVWQALQANLREREPANVTAVVAFAAHLLLMNMFPQFFSQYDELFQRQTAGIAAQDLARAAQVASPAMATFLASRLDDGFQDVGSSPPKTAPPGKFQDVASGTYRSLQQFSTSEPLCLPANESSVGFLTSFTEAYTYPSEAYDAQYTAVLLLGSNDSTVRQQSQTDTALFWADVGTGIAGHWNQLAIATLPENATLEDTAELLAMLNVAMYDSVVTGYALKYHFDIWRPISAIRLGDSSHAPDPTWTPLLQTPNNPTFPATQTALAGAAEIILPSFYGTDDYTFTIGSEYGSGTNMSFNPRTYHKFSDAASEVTESRYLGGTEFKADSLAGRILGQQVANYVLKHFDKLSSTP